MVYVTHDQIEAMTMSDRVAVFSAGLLRQVAAPRRLYEEPDSLFVAAVPGREQRAGRHGSAAMAASARGAAGRRDDGRHRRRRLRRGGKVDLVSRPEKVALGRGGQAAPIAFPARVVEVTFLGDQLRVRLAALGREDFVAEAANAAGQAALEPGGAVEIGWRTEDCRALV